MSGREEFLGDLALQGFGMTLEQLMRTMTEHELRFWYRYAAKKMLPWRRIELYLAQLAMVIDVKLGGVENARLSNYLFENMRSPEPEVPGEAAMGAAVGLGKVYRLSQGRRKKDKDG